MDYAANRQRSRSPIPLELNPVYKSSHVSRKESEMIGQPLRDISNERNTRSAALNRDQTEETNMRQAPQYIERDQPDDRDINTKSTTRYTEPAIKNDKYEFSYQRY